MIKNVIKVALNSVLLILVIIPLNFLISCSGNKNTSAGGVGPKPDKERKKSDKEGKKPDEENFKRKEKYKDWFDRHSKNDEDVKKVDDVEKKNDEEDESFENGGEGEQKKSDKKVESYKDWFTKHTEKTLPN